MSVVSKILIVAFSICLSACAKLNVGVEVLNSDKLKIRNEMPALLALDDVIIGREILSFKEIHYDYYEKQINSLKAKSETALKEDKEKDSALYLKSVEDLEMGFKSIVAPYYDNKEIEWENLVRGLIEQYENYDNNTEQDKEVKLRTALIISLEQYEAFKKGIIDYRKHDINDAIKDKELLTGSEHELTNPSQTLFKSGGVGHSPALYSVVNAPEKDWAKYFDRSYGSGRVRS